MHTPVRPRNTMGRGSYSDSFWGIPTPLIVLVLLIVSGLVLFAACRWRPRDEPELVLRPPKQRRQPKQQRPSRRKEGKYQQLNAAKPPSGAGRSSRRTPAPLPSAADSSGSSGSRQRFQQQGRWHAPAIEPDGMPEFNSTRGEDENAEAFEVDDEIHPDDSVSMAMFSRPPPQLPPPTTTLAPRKLAAAARPPPRVEHAT